MRIADVFGEYRRAVQHEAAAPDDAEADRRSLMVRRMEREIMSASIETAEDVALALEVVREIAVDGDRSGSDPLVRRLVESSIAAVRRLP